MLEIKVVSTQGEALEQVKVLLREYVTALNVDLAFQHFDHEIKDPLQKYGPPGGCLMLATHDAQAAGCIALQQLKPLVCEMKRLYTRLTFRQKGIGNQLITQLISQARNMGYRKMVLDTLSSLTPAIHLYKQHGFTETTAYYNNPLRGVIFMEKEL